MRAKRERGVKREVGEAMEVPNRLGRATPSIFSADTVLVGDRKDFRMIDERRRGDRHTDANDEMHQETVKRTA